MNKNIKLKAGGNNKRGPNEPIIGITGSGKYTCLWIGNNADNDKTCFATLSGRLTLLKFAHSIIEAIEGRKPVPDIKRLKQELSTKQRKSRRLK